MAKKLNIGAVARWVGTPILNFVNGSPDSVDLSQWVHNPRGFNLTYTVASGSLGEVTLVGSVVSFDGSGPQSSTPVSFNISDGSRTKESPQTFVTIVNEPVMDPAVPVNVQANGLTQDTIRITWEPGVGGPTPTSFPIYRSTTLNGTYTEIAAPATSPYDDGGFAPETTRWYKVSARIDGTESDQSTADAGTTLPEEQTGDSPVLFQDLSARDFAGEPGALALNNDWLNTVYDYVPRFAPTIPTIPVYTGAGNQAIVTNRAQLNTAMGNTAIKHIFVQKGYDDHGGSSLTINNGGTQVAPRWLIYYDPADPAKDFSTFKPWSMPVGSADRTQMAPTLPTTGAAWWYIVGLHWGKSTLGVQNQAPFVRAMLADGNANNIYWYRCAMENGAGHVWNVNSNNCNNIWAYQCVSHSHDGGGLAANGTWTLPPSPDIVSFIIQRGQNCGVVSCESWDTRGDMFHMGPDADGRGCVCEDNDFYVTSRHYCNLDGTPNVNGEFWMGEGPVDLKQMNVASTIPVKIYGNRFWGFRKISTARHDGNGNGAYGFGYSNDTVAKRYVDWRWNIQGEGIIENAIAMGSADHLASERHSFVRNLFYNLQCSRQALRLSYDRHEVYLNTIINCSGSPLISWTRADRAVNLVDLMGNLIIDSSGGWGSTGNITNATVGYGCYAGGAATFNVGYPGTDQSFANKSSLNLGNFRYLRKKLTTPEIVTVNSVVPTSSTPSAVTSMVPMSGGNQLGSRAGIGVDEVF